MARKARRPTTRGSRPDDAQSPRTSARDPSDAVRALRAAGRRASAPARLVLEVLFAAEGPLSADEIAAATKPQLDLSSVYRNLDRLEQVGVVGRLHPGRGPGLFTLVGDHEREYLICDECDTLTTLGAGQLDPIRERLRAEFGHYVQFTRFPMHGVCTDCASSATHTR